MVVLKLGALEGHSAERSGDLAFARDAEPVGQGVDVLARDEVGGHALPGFRGVGARGGFWGDGGDHGGGDGLGRTAGIATWESFDGGVGEGEGDEG